MSYKSSGTLMTDKREVAIDETWDTQTEWEAYQSKDDIVINSGILKLEQITIPDSEDLHARYDARELSAADGDPVSTWPDETANGHDLTAGTAPTYVESGINGNPVIRFDGVDDFLDVAWGTIYQPNHVFIVGRMQSIPSNAVVFFDSETSNHRHAIFVSGDPNPWAMHAGGTIKDGSADTSAHIFNGLFDGASSELRVDGASTITGDAGADGFNGLTVGAEVAKNSYANVDIGEILVYPMDKSAKETDIEQYLSDGWGVTL